MFMKIYLNQICTLIKRDIKTFAYIYWMTRTKCKNDIRNVLSKHSNIYLSQK